MERVFYYMTKRYVEEYKKTISSWLKVLKLRAEQKNVQ
jgi:hypothetical protein